MMMTNSRRQFVRRKGAALLIVLGVVMVVTIVALAYISRSDGELQYGQNMLLRTQADYLAESGLEHARGLILNPQEIDINDAWTATSQRLDGGSDFYYDVAVEPNTAYSGPTRWCDYDISCQAYRLSGGERTAQSSLKALLRLNPCIAYWSDTAADRQLSSAVAINGDVYSYDDLKGYDCNIEGDIFCDNLTGSRLGAGQVYPKSELSLDWPDVNVAGFTAKYTFDSISSSPLSGPVSAPYIKSDGDLKIAGSVRIDGMLIVDGNLTISGTDNVITAGKAVPAMLVTGDLTIEEGAQVSIEGLAVVNGVVNVSVGCGDVNVLGGLFAGRGIVETVKDSASGQSAILHGEPLCLTDGGHAGLSFDGLNDYAQTDDGSSTLQIISNYTFSVWLKASSTQKSWAGIISKTDPNGLVNHWTLQFDNNSPRRLIIHHPYGTWDTGIKITDIANQWHHIAVVRNAGTMTSYLDGVPRPAEVWAVSPASGYGHLNIGCNRTASDSYAYSGLIDDVQIYNQPLDANDVNYVMNGMGTTGGLIAHWKLDEDGQRHVEVTAAPAKTAIWCWSESSGELKREKWAQAAGAFYKDIRRN
jgi:hypothetical protein